MCLYVYVYMYMIYIIYVIKNLITIKRPYSKKKKVMCLLSNAYLMNYTLSNYGYSTPCHIWKYLCSQSSSDCKKSMHFWMKNNF